MESRTGRVANYNINGAETFSMIRTSSSPKQPRVITCPAQLGPTAHPEDSVASEIPQSAGNSQENLWDVDAFSIFNLSTINQVQEISRGECTVFLDEITGGKCNGNGVGGTPDNANSFP